MTDEEGQTSEVFLSTPSARRATRTASPHGLRWRISIHALREEGDPAGDLRRAGVHHFYPRPPRGGRPALDHALAGAIQFLSTPSARRATVAPQRQPMDICISIHALREEGDPQQRRC